MLQEDRNLPRPTLKLIRNPKFWNAIPFQRQSQIFKKKFNSSVVGLYPTDAGSQLLLLDEYHPSIFQAQTIVGRVHRLRVLSINHDWASVLLCTAD